MLSYVNNNRFAEPYQINYQLNIKSNTNNKSIKGLLKFKPDSVVWFNVVAKNIGFEIARVLLKHNNLKYIDRINSQFYEGDFEYLNRLTGLKMSVKGFERLITGQFVCFSTYNSSINEDMFIIHAVDKGIKYEYNVDSISVKQLENIQFPYINQSTTVDYYGRVKNHFINDINTGNKTFIGYSYKDKKAVIPEKISVKGEKSAKPFFYDIEIKRFEYLNEFKYRFTVPSSYVPIK